MAVSFDNPVFQARADQGKHAWWRYLLAVVLSLAVQALLLIVFAIAAVVAGVPVNTLLAATKDASQPLWFFGIIGASFVTWLTGIWLGAWTFNKKPAGDYLAGWQWPLFFAGFGLWLVILLANEGLDYVLQPKGFALKASLTPAIVAMTVGALSVQTFTEEYIFRGFATQGFLHLFKRPLPAAIVSGLVFGACHIPNGWSQALNATMLGVALALIAIKTGNMAFGYGLHLVNNLFGSLVFVSSDDIFKGAPGWFTQSTPSLDVLDLGLAGVVLVVLVLGFGMKTREG